MAARQNAISELTRFWLDARHSCLVKESVPVPVPRGQSDLDFVAMRSDLNQFQLPTGERVGPRLLVETKDVHDYDPSGNFLGKKLLEDIAALGDNLFFPLDHSETVFFTMLKGQHYGIARTLFACDDFDRLFIVNALDENVRRDVTEKLRSKRIYWLTVHEVLRDLQTWYRQHERPSGLRHTLFGDIFHLLFGYCKVKVDE